MRKVSLEEQKINQNINESVKLKKGFEWKENCLKIKISFSEKFMNNEKFGKLTKEYPKKNQQDFSKNRSVLKKKRLEQASEVKPRKNLTRSFYNLKFFLKKLAK